VAENPRIDDLRRRLDREPGSRVFAQLAEELRKAGQLAEAVRVARQGLLNHPAYPSARMTLGRALLDMRDLRGARTEFEAVLRGAPDNILASRYLGECLEGLGDLGSALLQYRATLRLAPGDRNLEAQIRALEQRLTPTGATSAPPAPPPPPVPPRPSLAPREGAIPVLEVDGPMELETSFEKSTPWQPPAVVQPVPTTAAVPEPGPAAAVIAEVAPPAPSPTSAEGAGPAAEVPPEPEPALEPEAPPAFATGAPPRRAAEPEPLNLNQSFPDEWEGNPPLPPGPPSPAPAQSESPALSSSTLAELYFNQGFTRQALDVYRELSEREPGNERIRARIAELEAIEREIDGETGIPAPASGDPKARRRQAIERTIARLEGFLATVRRA